MPTPEELKTLREQAEIEVAKDKEQGTGSFSKSSQYSFSTKGSTSIDAFNKSKKLTDDSVIDTAELMQVGDAKEEHAGFLENTAYFNLKRNA